MCNPEKRTNLASTLSAKKNSVIGVFGVPGIGRENVQRGLRPGCHNPPPTCCSHAKRMLGMFSLVQCPNPPGMLSLHGGLSLRASLLQLASLTVAGGDLSLVCQATIGSIDAIMETFVLEKVPGTYRSTYFGDILLEAKHLRAPIRYYS